VDDAILECKKKGMILAAPETIEENICIQRLIHEKGNIGSLCLLKQFFKAPNFRQNW